MLWCRGGSEGGISCNIARVGLAVIHRQVLWVCFLIVLKVTQRTHAMNNQQCVLSESLLLRLAYMLQRERERERERETVLSALCGRQLLQVTENVDLWPSVWLFNDTVSIIHLCISPPWTSALTSTLRLCSQHGYGSRQTLLTLLIMLFCKHFNFELNLSKDTSNCIYFSIYYVSFQVIISRKFTRYFYVHRARTRANFKFHDYKYFVYLTMYLKYTSYIHKI